MIECKQWNDHTSNTFITCSSLAPMWNDMLAFSIQKTCILQSQDVGKLLFDTSPQIYFGYIVNEIREEYNLDTMSKYLYCYFGRPGKCLYSSPQNPLPGQRRRPMGRGSYWFAYRCFPGGPKYKRKSTTSIVSNRLYCSCASYMVYKLYGYIQGTMLKPNVQTSWLSDMYAKSVPGKAKCTKRQCTKMGRPCWRVGACYEQAFVLASHIDQGEPGYIYRKVRPCDSCFIHSQVF
jgi:hypothetical protein